MVDNSANNRRGLAPVRARMQPLFAERLVATCGIIDLEALFSARSPTDYTALRRMRGALFEYAETDESDFRNALQIQQRMAERSQHRAGKIPDMVMSAVAIRNDLVVLHYDSDFELIEAAEPRLRHEWVVPRGSVPQRS